MLSDVLVSFRLSSITFSFLQAVLNPAAYTSADSRQKYRHLLEETNKILLFAGLSIDQSGRLVVVSQAETLTEVDLRVNHLKKALYDRAIHSEVQKYCIEDYLKQQKDWLNVSGRFLA